MMSFYRGIYRLKKGLLLSLKSLYPPLSLDRKLLAFKVLNSSVYRGCQAISKLCCPTYPPVKFIGAHCGYCDCSVGVR